MKIDLFGFDEVYVQPLKFKLFNDITMEFEHFVISTIDDEERVTVRILDNGFEITSDEGNFCLPRSINFDYHVHSLNFIWQPNSSISHPPGYEERSESNPDIPILMIRNKNCKYSEPVVRTRGQFTRGRGNRRESSTRSTTNSKLRAIKLELICSPQKSARSVVSE